MQCDFGQKNLNALADNELSGWQKWRVKRHLSKCAFCSAELTEIKKLSAQARTWRNAEPSPELKKRIAAAVFEQKPVVQNNPSFIHRKVFFKPVLITVSLLFVSLIIAATWFGVVKEDNPISVIQRRVAPALENVKNAHLVYSTTQRKQRELWFQDGVWLEKTYGKSVRIFRDGLLWEYDCETQSAKSFYAENYPGAFINNEEFRAVRDEFLRPNAEIVKAYKLGTLIRSNQTKINDYALENANSATRLIVAVDMSTDLPVRVEKQTLVGGEWVTQIKVDFEFNEKSPPEIFDIQQFNQKSVSLCTEK